MINLKIQGKYSFSIDSDGSTINHVMVSCNGKFVFRDPNCYKRNTNERFMVLMVKTLYGEPEMSVEKLTKAINGCYEFNNKWSELWGEDIIDGTE